MLPWILAAILLAPQAEVPKIKELQPEERDKDKPRKVVDEDSPNAVKEYTLDPEKSKKEVQVGDFYMRKGSFTAAVKRYEEASKWNPKSPLPFIKLGEALEKKDDPYRAAQAYRRFVELAPNDKHVGELRKKIEKLEKEAEK